jgi:L-asparaginase II
MLALAKFRGYNIDDYESITNPTQKEILNTISEFIDEDVNHISVGTDGCGAPIYLVPVNKIALSYARLVKYSQDSENPYHLSCKTVFEAMTKFPEMVAGDNEFCTELMRVTKGKLIGKVGSEGVYCVGIKDSNLGICIKIVDGNERAVYPVVIQVLRELDILDDTEYSKLSHWHSILLKNNLKEHIGQIIPTFSIKKTSTSTMFLGKKL